MSNYSKSTDFASKDALATGNANKIVRGTEIDDEFDAIQVAIATKANLNSPILTGTPLAPTAASGTNTTQISTTAFVKAAVDTAVAAVTVALSNSLYPVGSIYTNATNSNNPSTLLGFGTWVAFGSGRFIVGFDGSDVLFDSSEEVGGSKDITGSTGPHTLTVAEMPEHRHFIAAGGSTPIPIQGGTYLDATNQLVREGTSSNDPAYRLAGVNTDATLGRTSTSGSDGAHSHDLNVTNANLPPYITVYMWKRTA